MQRLDFLPQLVPVLAFGLGQVGERLVVAHTCKVGGFLPELHGGAGLVRIVLQHRAPFRQVGLQPSQALLAETGAFLFVERLGALVLATACKYRGTSPSKLHRPDNLKISLSRSCVLATQHTALTD